MLVLSRKVNERVRITLPDGTHGWVTLISVERNKVRIGFSFPTQLEITREELLPPDQCYQPLART